MRRSILHIQRWPVIFLLLGIALTAGAKEKKYVTGTLTGVVIEDEILPLDLGKAMPSIPQSGNIVLPMPVGVIYWFSIDSDGIRYSAACISRKKKSYAADWVIHDPIQFRIVKSNLLIKRPAGKELRLALIKKERISPAAHAEPASVAAKKSASQIIPKCR